MKKSVRIYSVFLPLLVAVSVFVPAKKGFAQSDKLTLEYQLSPALENAQVLGLTSLGINSEGAGAMLISGTLTNNTDEVLNELFFEFTFEAGKVGTIAKVTQQAAYPFSLDPFQVVYATNNDIQNETIPGIDESIKFDGGLTAQGEEWVESLENVTTLPNDVYTFNLTIYQFTLADGKQVMATQTIELGGGDGAVVDEKSIFLKSPGDIVGSEITITNQYPQFSWEGDAANEYRVLVVKGNGQDSPESLIESAKSSEPVNEAGSLLQFENLDITVEGNTIQYPSSGAQPLQAGQTYYWQVTSEVQTAIGAEFINSEIWSFKLSAPGEELVQAPINEDVFTALIQLIGEEQFSNLNENGYSLYSITYNGQTYSGILATQVLEDIYFKIEDESVIVKN
jgi:hypothetical protein